MPDTPIDDPTAAAPTPPPGETRAPPAGPDVPEEGRATGPGWPAAASGPAGDRTGSSNRPVAARDALSGHRAETRIGPHTRLEGTLRSDGPLSIRGEIQGAVHGAAEIHVEVGAHLQAEVSGATLRIDGDVEGQVSATERMELGATAHLQGEIWAGTLIMHEGAVVEGGLHMGRTAARFVPTLSEPAAQGSPSAPPIRPATGIAVTGGVPGEAERSGAQRP